MKTLSCKEVHSNNCDFIAEGETEMEVLHQLQLHEEKMHTETLGVLTPEQQAEREKIKRARLGIPMNTRDTEKEQ